MAVTTTQVQQLYLAYFGRPAEQAGLTYWTSQADANVTDISAAFAQSAEYTGVYGGLTRAQTIDTLYQNLFGRTAASNELNYWLNSTDVSVSNLALALVNGATGTDRLLLDTKAQYAATVTTNAGSAATAQQVTSAFGTEIKVAGQDADTTFSLSEYLALSESNTAAGYYNLANAAAKASVVPTVSGATLTGAGFGGLTAGSITLKDAAGSQTLALPEANVATSVSIKGNIAAAESLTITENQATGSSEVITSLTVNVTAPTAAGTSDVNKVFTLGVSDLAALTSIDASASTAGLSVGTSVAPLELAALSKITTGTGADTLYVNTAANTDTVTAAALTIETGAGKDSITSVVKSGALTINAGAGDDAINVTTGSAALTVNAGAGNDTVTLQGAAAAANTTAAHTASITLGEGSDKLVVTSLENLDGKFNFASGNATEISAANAAINADLIKVTDFNGSQDVLNITGLGAFKALSGDNTVLNAITNAGSLAEALTLVADNVKASATTTFQYGGNTYVYTNDSDVAVDSGDGLIELTGFNGQLTDANFIHATV